MKTFDVKPLSIPLSIVVVIGMLVAGLVLPAAFAPFPVEHLVSALWVGVAIMAIPSIVFALLLPHIKVGFLASAWRLPRHTFLFSRPLLRLMGSCLIGNLFATVILALFVSELYFPLVAMLVPTVIAFFYSAAIRLRRHPSSEFSMPIDLRRIIRTN